MRLVVEHGGEHNDEKLTESSAIDPLFSRTIRLEKCLTFSDESFNQNMNI